MREIAQRRAHDRDVDIRLGAFAAFVAKSIDRADGQPYTFMHYVAQNRPDISGSHFLTKLLRSGQARFHKNYPGYPHDMTTPEAWEGAFTWLYEPEQLHLSSQFEVDFMWHPLQSNVSERYKSVKALATVMHKLGRLPVFNMVDIGCSQNMGAKHIVSPYDFQPADILRRKLLFQYSAPYHGAAFNELASEALPLGLMVGIDQFHPRASYDWAYACSFNPSELLDLGRVAMYDALIPTEYENVQFFRGDFTDFNGETGKRFDAKFAGSFNQLYDDKGNLIGTDSTQNGDDADIYHGSAVFYQLEEPKRTRTLDIAKGRAGQLVAITDHLKVVDGELVIRDVWDAKRSRDFPFATAFWDKRAEDAGWQLAFEWRDGRAEQGRIGKGRLIDEWGESRPIFNVANALAKTIKRSRERQW